MMKRFILIFIILFFAISTVLYSQQKEDKTDIVELNLGFYYRLYKTELIGRDDFLAEKIGRMIRADGIVKNRYTEKRYKNEVCIVVQEPESEKYSLKIDYYIFFKSMDEAENFIRGVNFSFTGQITGFTPVNSNRTHYIIDIVYQSGTISIE